MPFSGTRRPTNPTTMPVGRGSPPTAGRRVRIAARGWKRSGSTPSGMTRAARRIPSPRRCVPPRCCTPRCRRPRGAPIARASGRGAGSASRGSAPCRARRAVRRRRSARKQQDLGRGERERLLVDVDDVPLLAEGAPERARVVEEQRGMACRTSRRLVTRSPGSGSQRHERTRPRASDRALRSETSTPRSARARSRPRHSSDHCAMRYPQHAHAAPQRRLFPSDTRYPGDEARIDALAARSKGNAVVNGAFTVPAVPAGGIA